MKHKQNLSEEEEIPTLLILYIAFSLCYLLMFIIAAIIGSPTLAAIIMFIYIIKTMFFLCITVQENEKNDTRQL